LIDSPANASQMIVHRILVVPVRDLTGWGCACVIATPSFVRGSNRREALTNGVTNPERLSGII
jgi:hypothetical protein